MVLLVLSIAGNQNRGESEMSVRGKACGNVKIEITLDMIERGMDTLYRYNPQEDSARETIVRIISQSLAGGRCSSSSGPSPMLEFYFSPEVEKILPIKDKMPHLQLPLRGTHVREDQKYR